MNRLGFFQIILFAVIAFCSSASAYSQTENTDNLQVVDKVIAVVGQNMVKESELETAYLQQKSNRGIIEDAFMVRCDLFEGMLINELMLHQAEKDSIVVTDEEVNREMDNRIKYMVQMYGSVENLEKQMKKSISEIRAFYSDVIRENIMIGQIEHKLTGDVTITPQEVADFYKSIPQDSLPIAEDEYVFSQIVKLPKVSEEEKNAVKDRLNDYRDRILKGSKFSTIALLYSEDPGSAKKGGELGFFSRGDMVSEFENAAFALQDGEISPVIETQYGFHIIQMIERRGNQVNCRHILLQPKVSDAQLLEAKEELEKIKSEIEKGEITFEDAIIKYSDDESKINRGLVINPYNASASFTKDNINETMSNLDKVDFSSMKEGDITNPVLFKAESANAYRLIKVDKKVDAHRVNLVDDYGKIQESALSSRKLDIIKEWAEKRIAKTYIRIDKDYQDCDFKLNWLKK
ncbi:MAG: peptidylprolyl isomerase [Bacteroidales bacterium]|nr:peptidylprolyl isomerase [Bacteroidales bacterium]